MVDERKVDRKQLGRIAAVEINDRYSNENDKDATMIADVCDYFNINAVIYENDFSLQTLYTPYSGLTDRTIIINKLEDGDQSHYELIIAEMKGKLRTVFKTEELLIRRLLDDLFL
uniref:Uncharacterized protein n=1 Tax=Pithovirus LCPAC404 TaxID=2506597 RepID=A0A481ZCD3_9VIRU|nr:MAG: hypothetical protein LCPAC404_02520 [Pithovirus LCPAC404]